MPLLIAIKGLCAECMNTILHSTIRSEPRNHVQATAQRIDQLFLARLVLA